MYPSSFLCQLHFFTINDKVTHKLIITSAKNIKAKHKITIIMNKFTV